MCCVWITRTRINSLQLPNDPGNSEMLPVSATARWGTGQALTPGVVGRIVSKGVVELY